MSKRNQQEQLQQQLSALTESVEALLAAEVDVTDTYYLGLKAKAELALSQAREALEVGKETVIARSGRRIRKINQFVTERPWRTLALGWAAGMICGIVTTKR
ncbi:DUF883 family protein [Tatumella sp. TA1]|uniref:DUF883 family protein n=1 Tax=Rosenbergiella collisarenosi TaxID=1544695 RepID=UPI0008F88B5C|nr:DUF883 family protein [Rosenbergiella collisarenosi]MBT0720538.1 DUF883 family protein [Rosenbergiella collisarenosi]QGX91825.1 DUF883 family protein [Tatumella sp. TA1]